MIKVSNIILIGTLIATVATAGPKAMQCIELNHSIKTAEASITDTNSKLLKVDDKLKHAKDKCVDIQISSNYEVAKTIAITENIFNMFFMLIDLRLLNI